jgi:hypothetical protein
MFAALSVTSANQCSKVIDNCLQFICNVETGVSVVPCICALVEYWLRGGDDVVYYSLPMNIRPPIRDDWIQYVLSDLLDLHLNSAFSKWVAKACLVRGVYSGRRTFRNLFQYTLPVRWSSWIHSSSKTFISISLTTFLHWVKNNFWFQEDHELLLSIRCLIHHFHLE